MAKSSKDPINGTSSLPAREQDHVDDHAYNDPQLPPMEFLLAVMHDRRTPMAARIDAAKAVSVYMHPRLAQVTQEVTAGIKIVIEGGLPALPGTNIIMPEEHTSGNVKMNGKGDEGEE